MVIGQRPGLGLHLPRGAVDLQRPQAGAIVDLLGGKEGLGPQRQRVLVAVMAYAEIGGAGEPVGGSLAEPVPRPRSLGAADLAPALDIDRATAVGAGPGMLTAREAEIDAVGADRTAQVDRGIGETPLRGTFGRIELVAAALAERLVGGDLGTAARAGGGRRADAGIGRRLRHVRLQFLIAFARSTHATRFSGSWDAS